jgi:DNA polymerase III subunit delta'
VPIVPLVGHEPLRVRLSDAAARGTLPASLLLHGPVGVGKQRLGLWLGQLLLCANEGVRPCGACRSCRYVADLAHPDLHWFFPRPRPKGEWTTDDAREDMRDAIGERAKADGLYAAPPGSEGYFVATIHALVQAASMTPALGRRKVFLVGDAERMVAQEGAEFAANAFLKLLEEPPADTTIILTTSEPGALLPTIRSRVVSIRVPRLAEHDVRAWLALPQVSEALDSAGAPKGVERRLELAAGAPGVLLGATGQGAALEAARRLLEAATGPRAGRYRTAYAQGAAGARGAFSEMLDALTVLLHERTRSAAQRGRDDVALGAARAIDIVERSKAQAFGNVNPQLVSAALIRELSAVLR